MVNCLFKLNNFCFCWFFYKVLIVNWGEIVVWIIWICWVLGLVMVVVYLMIDVKVFYVKLVDEVVCIGLGSVEKSYLNISVLIGVVLVIGVDVVYFGFGFLLESVVFVCVCQDNDLIFIGLSLEMIVLFGDKEVVCLMMCWVGLFLVKGS